MIKHLEKSNIFGSLKINKVNKVAGKFRNPLTETATRFPQIRRVIEKSNSAQLRSPQKSSGLRTRLGTHQLVLEVFHRIIIFPHFCKQLCKTFTISDDSK